MPYNPRPTYIPQNQALPINNNIAYGGGAPLLQRGQYAIG
jgi:hypothetical protein